MNSFDIIIKDYRGYIFSHLYEKRKSLLRFVYTLWCRIKMSFWGISYGKDCQFRGNMIFFRGPGAKIVIGNNCTFNSHSYFNFRGINHPSILQAVNKGTIIIGNNCGFSGVSIVSSVQVIIGEKVMCGTNVIIGDRNDHESRYPEWQPSPIVIGDNVWIGMNSIIMRGVTIGENSIIGAGSLVTKNIPANCIAAGNPCHVIKERIINSTEKDR